MKLKNYKQFNEATHWSASELGRQLITMVFDYNDINDKTLITKIVKLIDTIPELSNANNIRKEQINKVYRGIALKHKISASEVVKKDKRQDQIAATTDLVIAQSFLENEFDGYIIEYYNLKPDNIILVLDIFKTVVPLYESEVIVNVSTASYNVIKQMK